METIKFHNSIKGFILSLPPHIAQDRASKQQQVQKAERQNHQSSWIPGITQRLT